MATPKETRKVRRIGANGREYVQNTMRFPPHLYEALRDSAKAGGRTMNAEVVLRLMQSCELARIDRRPTDTEELGLIPVYSIANDVAVIRQLLEQIAERGAA